MAKTELQLLLEEKAKERAMNAQRAPQQVEAQPQPATEGMSESQLSAWQSLPRASGDGYKPYESSQFIGNIGESGAEYGKALIAPITDPKMALEAVKAMFTSEGIEALGQFYKDRYGSSKEALRTAFKDPVGFLSDVSIVGGPLKLTGTMMKLINKRLGSTVGRVGEGISNLDPASVATATTLAGISNLPVVRGQPESIYETALKMGTSPKTRMGQRKTREQVIQTLLEGGIPVTREGEKKLDAMISARTQQLDELIDMAEAEGKTIPLSQITSELKALRDDISDPTVNPRATEQAAAIESFAMNWLSDLGPVRELTPSQVRKLRQNLDAELNYDRIGSTTPPLQKRMTEAVASGARQGLRDVVEGYGQTGMDISKMLTAQEALARAVNRLDQNQSIGLKQAIGIGIGTGVGAGSDAIFSQVLGLIMAGGALAMSPQNKQRLARLIYNSRDLTREQKNALLGQVLSQAGPTQQRIEEGMQGTEQ